MLAKQSVDGSRWVRLEAIAIGAIETDISIYSCPNTCLDTVSPMGVRRLWLSLTRILIDYYNQQVQGLGPFFKIKMSIQNTGNKPITHTPITLSYNRSLYAWAGCFACGRGGTHRASSGARAVGLYLAQPTAPCRRSVRLKYRSIDLRSVWP